MIWVWSTPAPPGAFPAICLSPSISYPPPACQTSITAGSVRGDIVFVSANPAARHPRSSVLPKTGGRSQNAECGQSAMAGSRAAGGPYISAAVIRFWRLPRRPRGRAAEGDESPSENADLQPRRRGNTSRRPAGPGCH